MNRTLGIRIVLLLPLFVVGSFCHAATLSMPARGPYSIGQTFSIPVYVSMSPGENMNAVSATISFPNDKLQMTGITKGSVVDFWVKEPSYSNGSGSAQFEGIKYNPGFSGQNGLVVTLSFKVIGSGSALLSFSSASVLANDGQGTNILDSADSTTINLSGGTPSPAQEQPAPPVQPQTPAGPKPTITSSTHPDPSAWYIATTADFSWNNVPATLAVRTGIDSSPSGSPRVVNASSVTSKETSVSDGVSYFHVQDQTASGWGSIATFKIQVDTTAPSKPVLSFTDGDTYTSLQPTVTIKSTDSLSGIDHYVLTTSGGKTYTVPADSLKNSSYQLPEQEPGKLSLTAVAYDNAGNASDPASADISLQGITAPQLDPIEPITEGGLLEISGTSYPNSRIDVFVKDSMGNETTYNATTSANGTFGIIWPKRLPKGTWTVQAQVTNEQGLMSARTAPIDFKVRTYFQTVFKNGLLVGAIILGLLLLVLAGLAFLFWFMWNLFKAYRVGVLHRLYTTDSHVHEQFSALRIALTTQVAELKKIRKRRTLTPEEDALIDRFQDLLDSAEETIDHDIKKIIRGQKKTASEE